MDQILQKFDLVPLDVTMILVGAVFFALLTKVLGRFMFAPYLALTEAREKATVGATADASSKTEQAKALGIECDERIRRERIEALQGKFLRVSKAREQASKIVSEAENEVRVVLERARAEAEREIAALRTRLDADVPSLSDQVVQKVLRG